ncbi:ComF family protein [Nitrosophilus kaiyonis]|uniref:ComF family protein n=1 Tax=Nitrosophilus kaiyonis TaxID=2930200 RepID=UPI00248F8223|nr:ComF family protein [Nitrosophilus kaiyonis]
MRCLICERFSLKLICNSCQKEFLTPKLIKREIAKDFYVYSFYKYKEIEELIKTKHHFIGSFIFEILAQNSFKKFSNEFKSEEKIYALSIESKKIDQYSHTAILSNSLKSKTFIPLYNKLVAKNRITYSGKSYEYRIKNTRDFIYNGPKNVDIVLIDDIVTTGLTLKEAYCEIKKYCNPLFALTLADARN